LNPLITVYSGGSNSKTKKFDSIISAAFWAGVDYGEEDINSVKIRQPGLSGEADVVNLIEFATLLVQRQINFTVEFSTESRPAGNPRPQNEEKPRMPVLERNGESSLESELVTFKKEKSQEPSH
jgi:hypothetical protein